MQTRRQQNIIFFFFFLVLPVYCYQPISLHPCAHMLSHVIPWTSACQAPLSIDFSRQEYWSGLQFPSPQNNIFKGQRGGTPWWSRVRTPPCQGPKVQSLVGERRSHKPCVRSRSHHFVLTRAEQTKNQTFLKSMTEVFIGLLKLEIGRQIQRITTY